jgi:hypothetical protein
VPAEGAEDVANELRGLLAVLDVRTSIAGSDQVADRHAQGAANLADYLALRSRDLRPLQVRLARLGLSSLGRAEGHVRTTVAAALRACATLAGQAPGPLDTCEFDDGPARLGANATELLGPSPKNGASGSW